MVLEAPGSSVKDTVMATFSGSDDLQGSDFLGVNLRGSRFVRSSLSGAVMRGLDVVVARRVAMVGKRYRRGEQPEGRGDR